MMIESETKDAHWVSVETVLEVQLVTFSNSSGCLARESRWLACDITFVFVLLSASVGSKRLMLPFTVTANQTKNRPITADEKLLLGIFEIATLNLNSIQKCIAREAS